MTPLNGGAEWVRLGPVGNVMDCFRNGAQARKATMEATVRTFCETTQQVFFARQYGNETVTMATLKALHPSNRGRHSTTPSCSDHHLASTDCVEMGADDDDGNLKRGQSGEPLSQPSPAETGVPSLH
mmetsp:Transcript_19932/g.47529  ORF Transcript_19932/g.47529 Transcript_19932/m.47529 type:complete len:127 (+) Transcript_19932:277-657(+)